MSNDILIPQGTHAPGVASHPHAKEEIARRAAENKKTAPVDEVTEAVLGEISFGGTGTVTPA